LVLLARIFLSAQETTKQAHIPDNTACSTERYITDKSHNIGRFSKDSARIVPPIGTPIIVSYRQNRYFLFLVTLIGFLTAKGLILLAILVIRRLSLLLLIVFLKTLIGLLSRPEDYFIGPPIYAAKILLNLSVIGGRILSEAQADKAESSSAIILQKASTRAVNKLSITIKKPKKLRDK